MYKGKIKTHCGNEFTVFFLKDGDSNCSVQSHSLDQISPHIECNLNWMDVNENSAGAGYTFSYSTPDINPKNN
jgi:hypothetical protein